jgi:hypothetical protein
MDDKELKSMTKRKSGNHKLKYIKGYTLNGRRLYKCSCGKDVIDWTLAEAIKRHSKQLREENENSSKD